MTHVATQALPVVVSNHNTLVISGLVLIGAFFVAMAVGDYYLGKQRKKLKVLEIEYYRLLRYNQFLLEKIGPFPANFGDLSNQNASGFIPGGMTFPAAEMGKPSQLGFTFSSNVGQLVSHDLNAAQPVSAQFSTQAIPPPVPKIGDKQTTPEGAKIVNNVIDRSKNRSFLKGSALARYDINERNYPSEFGTVEKTVVSDASNSPSVALSSRVPRTRDSSTDLNVVPLKSRVA